MYFERPSIYLLLPVVHIAQLLPLLQVFDLKETCSPSTPLCSPFIPSGFAGPLPGLGSAVHLVFPLLPTPFPLFAVNAACQELV